jgi:site-specific recombinase XerD
VDKLRDLHLQLDKGITPMAGYAHYTVRQAARDWLASGLDGRSPKTVTKNQNVLEPILAAIGARKLRDLTAADVRQALAAMAAGYSTAAVTMAHLALKRAIRHAEANDLVARNVAALADTPKGQEGRPSKSLTLDQAVAVITAARTLPVMELRPGLKDVRRPAALMHAYIVLSLLAGIRTEAGIGDGWTPRELRTTFVSLLSHRGVSIEEIARLVGHASTRTTEIVYRRELRPVITTGAEIMDELFTGT